MIPSCIQSPRFLAAVATGVILLGVAAVIDPDWTRADRIDQADQTAPRPTADLRGRRAPGGDRQDDVNHPRALSHGVLEGRRFHVSLLATGGEPRFRIVDAATGAVVLPSATADEVTSVIPDLDLTSLDLSGPLMLHAPREGTGEPRGH